MMDGFPGFIREAPTGTMTLIAGRWRRAESVARLLFQK
jgi:hypothetical protein